MSTQQSINPDAGPLARAARLGLWALPVWAVLLFVGTFTQQPDPKADLAGWSRYVTTPEFLASHLIASILGAAIAALGLIALGAVLASRGHPRAGLWVIVTGVIANVVSVSVIGIAAFAQPAIGRDYLAGHSAQAHLLVNTVVNGTWVNATAIPSGLLLAASVVIAGVAVARTRSLPRAAGVGFAISIVLFSIGAFQDNFIETIGCVLMIASTVWIAVAAGRPGAPALVGTDDTAPAATQAGPRPSRPAAAR